MTVFNKATPHFFPGAVNHGGWPSDFGLLSAFGHSDFRFQD
jgi:hypothetical protein